MKSLRKLLLACALLCLLVGAIFPNMRLAAIGLGIALLIADFLFERSPARQNSKIAGLSKRSEIHGTFGASGTSLIVSPTSSLKQSLNLEKLDGTYSVEIAERFNDALSLVSRITISRQGEPGGERDGGSVDVTATKGWLLFLSGSYVARFAPNEIEQTIQQELKRLPRSKPLCFWLKDENGVNAGIVVSTGEGNGTFAVTYTTRGGTLSEVSSIFMGR